MRTADSPIRRVFMGAACVMAAPYVMATALLGAACRRPPREVVMESGGVRISQRAEGVIIMSGGTLNATVTSDAEIGVGLTSLRLTGGAVRGPIAIETVQDGKTLGWAARELRVIDGVASLRQGRKDFDGELVLTVDPSAPAMIYKLHAQRLDTSRDLRFRIRVPRVGVEVAFAGGAPYAVGAEIPTTTTPYVVVGGAQSMTIASPTGLVVETKVDEVVATTPSLNEAYGTVDATFAIGLSPTLREALLLGARLSKSGTRSGATIAIEPRDGVGVPIAARIMIEAQPTVAPPQPLVFDPTREAEPTLPMIDAVTPRTVLTVPAGRYVLRATHGIGWSIAKTTIVLQEGESIRVPLQMEEEVTQPGFIGCDLHVHARGSYDAKLVSYEDRVRSLVAVGVDCAAATEHDHIGDHSEAAKSIGVDPIFRGLPGVELTTGFPQFGHFNVYPWPPGARIPITHETTPEALFSAVHALPGSFVFQLNHPRMRTGDGISIGYFDVAGVDPKTGVATGAHSYLRGYDALEIFNGYHLHEPDKVIELTQEWLRMIDRGDVHVATGSSDSHNLSFPWAGFPRTMIEVGADWKKNGRPFEVIVAALKKGRASITSGPVLRINVGAARVGDDVKAEGSTAHVEVALTSWLRSPKVHLYVGADDLGELTLRADPALKGLYAADVPLKAVTKRRSLVAIAQAMLVDDVKGITGMEHALAITNPVWLTP